ncbi:MAG: O-antigen ligase family protein [Thermoleophilia bacterium]
MPEGQLDTRSRLVLAAACLMVLFTAFEVRTLTVPLGPISLTTSEFAAGIFIAFSLVYAAAHFSWYRQRRVLDLAVALFLLTNFLSAALAAEDKPGAFKFSLRMTFAALVYVAVSRLPARARSHIWVAGAVTAALAIVTIVGLLENFTSLVYWPRVLGPFQEGIITFGTYYNIRIASTLPFPTVLSMYLELALPLALAFGLWISGRRSNSPARRRWLGAATLVLIVAVMLVQVNTYTRSALVATPVSMLAGAVAAALFGYGRRVWGFLVLGVGILVLTVVLSVLFSNKMASRLDVTEQEQHYGAEYKVTSMPADLALDTVYTARIHIRNTGSIIWTPSESEGVTMTYRWLNYPEKEYQEVDFLVTDMPHNVPPGGEVDMIVDFKTPSENGRYVFVTELVKAHVGWFSAAGPEPIAIPLEFVNGSSQPWILPDPDESFREAKPAVTSAPRSQLWQAGLKTWKANPILGVGPDQYRKRYNEYMPELQRDEKVRTHNIYLESLATTGVVGFAAMLYLLFMAFLVQFRLVRNRDQKPGARLVSLALPIASVAYVTHGMLDCFLWQTGVALLFFTFLGLTSWLDASVKEEQVNT